MRQLRSEWPNEAHGQKKRKCEKISDKQFPHLDAGTESLSVFGPRSGYSTQIGFLVSQLNWMRNVVLSRLQNLSVEELDWLPQSDANSIGALLMHLAAADVYYG